MMVKTKMMDGVNHILHQNDWIKPHLVDFAGKIIQLSYRNDFVIQLMQINNDGSLSLVNNSESQPSLTIKISNKTVFQIITKQDLDDIEIQGDMKLAKKMSELLKNLEWDLSLEVEKYLGPQAAGIYQSLSKTQTEEFWVNFKVWGMLPITIVFTGFQIPLINKHKLDA